MRSRLRANRLPPEKPAFQFGCQVRWQAVYVECVHALNIACRGSSNQPQAERVGRISLSYQYIKGEGGRSSLRRLADNVNSLNTLGRAALNAGCRQVRGEIKRSASSSAMKRARERVAPRGRPQGNSVTLISAGSFAAIGGRYWVQNGKLLNDGYREPKITLPIIGSFFSSRVARHGIRCR